MRLAITIACAASLILACSVAWCEQPRRQGLTIEGGWGLGYTAAVGGGRATEGSVDATSVGIGVGVFLTPALAVLCRVGPSHGYSVIDAERIFRVTQTPLAGVLEWFPHPRWMVSAGGALMVRVTDDVTVDTAQTATHRGAGLVLRGGHGFANWETVGLRLTLEIIAARYERDTLVSSFLGFEVQSF